MDRTLQSIRIAKRAGFNFVRMDVAWNSFAGTTPSDPRNYGHVNEIVNELNAQGLGLILILTGTVTLTGWGSLAEWTMPTATDRANHVALYCDLVVFIKASLHGDLIVQAGKRASEVGSGWRSGWHEQL